MILCNQFNDHSQPRFCPRNKTHRKECMVPKNVVITPIVFFDLFGLSLFFRAKQAGRDYQFFDLGAWTTVNCVARVLKDLGIITPTQHRKLSDDTRTQAIFVRNALVTHEIVNHQAADEETSHKIIVRYPDDLTGQMSRKRILMDIRVFLSRRGLNSAQVMEKYYPWFTESSFLGAYNSSRNRFNTKSKGGRVSIMTNYRQKVSEEMEITRFMRQGT